MLKLSKYIVNRPVLSIRLGRPVAQALEPIINPNNLKIEGWFCKDMRSNAELILQMISIREVFNEGLVIDDVDELLPLDDLVRLQKIVDLQFSLIGKTVLTDSKKRLGKVSDYAVEPDSMIIKKLYISQNILRDFGGGGRVVDRTQIIEITDTKVIVKDETAIKHAVNQSVIQAATEPA